MLDLYTFGEVERISPEAPVPIVRVLETQRYPGGAGNALLNMVSIGLDCIPFGRIGDDEEGDCILECFKKENIECQGMFRDPSYQTPLKNRVIAAGQQILRIDRETPKSLNKHLEEACIERSIHLMQEVDVVAISDYAKGFLTPNLVQSLIKEANKSNIPIVVDPKGREFTRYSGATVLKPNLKEAMVAAALDSDASLDEIALHLLEKINIETLMVTRSREGISLFNKILGRRDFPTNRHEIKDVTGAGDTVLAVITAALANRIDLSIASTLANVAAGMAIERVGCARISITDLMERASAFKCL